ncbi:hypothetical protein CRM22_000793 [Opisthorchis felineus]|uniref:Tyrosine-protein phosphatase non-receptor type 9 n=1 Tax=Opisthorchis felineus TaxID=147828 RepID=A0A4S2MDH0_OPIFE|nr:hypothetical protein CRM22_000793 [Opisthorchis felineus]
MKHPFECYKITEEEFRRLEEFIAVSSAYPSNASQDTKQTAFCFLAARKFSVAQALELYHNYKAMLSREGIPDVIDPFDEETRRELLSGKFVVLNDSETSGVRVVQYFVRLHHASHNPRAVLQSILFQLDAVMKKEVAARNGLVFIYDMTDAKFSNIDCTLGIKLFKILKSSYPVRLRRILILTAPLWFRASFRMMRVFIRDQLRDNVNVLRPSPGTKLDALSHPDFIALKRDHHAWLHTALIRTGWLPSESDQITRPNGHRFQTAAAFFGQTSTSQSPGSVSDLSDPDSKEDEDSLSGNPWDEDELMSVGDLDPFALSSSYSSETDSTGSAKVKTDLRTCDKHTSPHASDIHFPRASKIKSATCESVVNQDGSFKRKVSSGRDCSPINLTEVHLNISSNSRGDHAETPTPPSVAKRLILPADSNYDVNAPNCQLVTTTSATMTRPTRMDYFPDKDMGFSENLSAPLVVESTTPTTDAVEESSTTNLSGNVLGGLKSHGAANRYRNSAGADSSCSSTTSFFSTGSAGLSSTFSTQSTDCSPTNESAQRIMSTRALLGQTKANGVTISGERSTWPDGSGIHRIAPLAEDEIGDQTIRIGKKVNAVGDSIDGDCMDSDDNDHDEVVENPVHDATVPTHPPTDSCLPTWAVGRPHGASIHQGPVESPKVLDPISAVITDTGRDACSQVPFADESPPVDPPGNLSAAGDCQATAMPSEKDIELKDSQSPMANEAVDPGLFADKTEVDEEEEDLEGDLYEISEDSDSDQSICLDDHWMTPVDLAKHVESIGLSGIQSEYGAVVRIKNDDPRSAFRHAQNRDKNRYCDVICYESSRVHLRPASLRFTSTGRKDLRTVGSSRSSNTNLHRTLSAPTAPKDLVRNYIHANWVDGYRQKNAFICTQGPLSETVGDFWQMIWDYHVPIIVMITKVLEADRVKCFPYWPDSVGKKMYFACGHSGPVPVVKDGLGTNSSLVVPEFAVENMGSQTNAHFTCSTLQFTHLPNKQRRTVLHYACSSWPDHGVPQTTEGLQRLLFSVQTAYTEAIRLLGYSCFMEQEVPPPPVVVHCSAGIGRTGTYVTADICTKWLVDEKQTDHLINIPLTVSRVRSQRYGCVQVAAQYVFCYRVVLDFAIQTGLLTADQAQSALSILSPASNSLSQSSTTSFYHCTSLPRPHLPLSSFISSPFGQEKSSGRMAMALSDFRNLLPTSQLLSIWHALRVSRDHKTGTSGAGNISDSDFNMTENVCSDSDVDEDEEEEYDGDERYGEAMAEPSTLQLHAEKPSSILDGSGSHDCDSVSIISERSEQETPATADTGVTVAVTATSEPDLDSVGEVQMDTNPS